MIGRLSVPKIFLAFFLFFATVGCVSARAESLPADSVAVSEWTGLDGLPIGDIWCAGNSRTRDNVIIQELLVSTGDPFDPDLIEESERNLRNLMYLKTAEIVPHYNIDRGVVDLEIQVSDRLSWIVLPVPSFGGGRFDMDFIFANMNLIGRGQSLVAQGHVSSEEADTYIGEFEEPRLFGTRLGGSVAGGRQGELGEQFEINVRKPLYSLSTRWAYEASAFDWEVQRQLYDSGEQVSSYYRRQIGGSCELTRCFRYENKRFGINLSYVYFDERNEHDEGWSGAIPQNKRRGIVRAEFGAERFRFVEDTYLFQMGPVEDVQLGTQVFLRVGGALEALGSDRNYPEIGLSFGWFGGVLDPGFARVNLSSDARIEDGDIVNHTGNASLGLFYHIGRYDLLSWQTRGEFQRRMEDPSQLLLGSGRGLRGYEAQAYDGSRLLVSTIEWRHALTVSKRWALALALFTDAGTIWSGNQSISDVPFLVGAGTGVRLSFPGIFSGPVFRFDVGYGFKDGYVDFSFGV